MGRRRLFLMAALVVAGLAGRARGIGRHEAWVDDGHEAGHGACDAGDGHGACDPGDGHGACDAGEAGDTMYLYVARPSVRHVGGALKDGSLEHPFSSLEEARAGIRALRARHSGMLPKNGVTVRLRAGMYVLPAGLLLGPEDSGTEGSPVIFTAFPGEKVVLIGGRRIPASKVRTLTAVDAVREIGARKAGSHLREIDLRALGISDYGVHGINGFRRPYANAAMELFINGRPYHLARYPDSTKILLDTSDVVNNGLTPKGVVPATSVPGSIRFDKKKLAEWATGGEDGSSAGTTGIMVSGNFNFAWATDQLRVASTDAKTGIVYFADAHVFGIKGGNEWNQYYFFNIPQELDQPGEYYIDAGRGKIYFYPLEPLQAADTILVSMLEEALVSLKGASFVQFRDLTFEAGRGIGIYMEKTLSNRVENCTIRNMGVVGVCIGMGSQPEKGNAHPDPFHPVCPNEPLSGGLGSLHELLYENTVFNRQGGKNNGVIGCRIGNTGCGGISLGGGDRVSLGPAGNYVYDCEFTNCGRIDYSYKSPVNIDGVGNKIQHCQFNACPATAIYLHGNNHLIEYNRISEACNFVDDQGAIYMGRDPSEAGNTIRWNFFNNIGHSEMMTMAVYFDDGACGTELYGNVFYKAGTRTIMMGGGSYNHMSNNIFIDSKMAIHLDDRLSNWANNSLDSAGLFRLRLHAVGSDHAPYSTAYPWLASYFSNHPELPQHNDIGKNIFLKVSELHNGEAKWGPIHDDNLITTGDPGFVDAAGLNFSLRKDAAVFSKLPGFKDIPFSEIGLIKK